MTGWQLNAWPENIQVVEERLEPADKTCHRCGQDRCLIREEASERLDLIPAQLIRRRTLRPIYGCSRTNSQPFSTGYHCPQNTSKPRTQFVRRTSTNFRH